MTERASGRVLAAGGAPLARLALVVLALLVSLAPGGPVAAAQNQEPVNWLQAASDGQLQIVQLTGLSSFGLHPVLTASLKNTTSASLTVRVAPADVLRPAQPGWCSVALAGLDQPITLAAGETRTDIDLPGYCLQVPGTDNSNFPDATASYLPLNSGGQAPGILPQVIDRARQAGWLDSYATQLAVWQVYGGIADFNTLASRLDLPNPETYRAQVASLITGSTPAPEATTLATLPVATATSQGVAPVATSAEPATTGEPVAQSTPSSTPGAGVLGGLDPLLVIGVIVVVVLVFALLIGLGLAWWFSRRQSKTTRPGASQLPVRQATALPGGDNRTGEGASEGPALTWCMVCHEMTDHTTQNCPRRARGDRPITSKRDAPTIPNPGGPVAPPLQTPSAPKMQRYPSQASSSPPAGSPAPPAGSPAPPSSSSPPSYSGTVPGRNPAAVASSIPANAGPGAALAHHHLQQNVAAGNVIARAATKPVGSISPNGGRQPTGAVTSRPPIYYAIQEDGQHRSYLGNQGGLLARSNFDKRQILIEQNGISTPHAVIRFLDKDTVTVRDLNSLEGTYVLTEKLTPGQAKTVLDGQPLQFGGGVRFALDMQNRMLKSRTPGVSDWNLAGSDIWLITRHPLVSVQLQDSVISDPHLLIRPGEQGLDICVRDLGSVNGTAVDGQDLRQMEQGTYVARQRVEFDIVRHHYRIEVGRDNTPVQIGDHYQMKDYLENSQLSDLYLVTDSHDPQADILVAKVPILQQDTEEMRQRVWTAFKREVNLAQTLQNDHFLPAYDASLGENPYLIMPYVPNGCDLDKILRARRTQGARELALPDIKAIFDDLLEAIDYLHQEHWVHCDLKPANILLQQGNGELFVIDLGAATPVGQSAEFHTKPYSAPETGDQTGKVQPAADVFSLGGILFELLTGRPFQDLGGIEPPQPGGQKTIPAAGPTPRPDLYQLLSKTPDYVQEFTHVIEKAIQDRPANRYPDISSLRDALNAVYAQPRVAQALQAAGSPGLARLVDETCGPR